MGRKAQHSLARKHRNTKSYRPCNVLPAKMLNLGPALRDLAATAWTSGERSLAVRSVHISYTYCTSDKMLSHIVLTYCITFTFSFIVFAFAAASCAAGVLLLFFCVVTGAREAFVLRIVR